MAYQRVGSDEESRVERHDEASKYRIMKGIVFVESLSIVCLFLVVSGIMNQALVRMDTLRGKRINWESYFKYGVCVK